MASEKEIKNRIKSIKDTQKITNAMYLISSTKLRKAREQLEKAKPFSEQLGPCISALLGSEGKFNSPYFDDYVDPKGELHRKDRPKRKGYLVITADKGLAGAYNHNILKVADAEITSLREELEKHIAEGDDDSFHGKDPYKFYVVGELGRQYFKSKGIKVSHHFLYTAQDPKLSRARAITHNVLPAFERGQIDELYIIYTHMVNSVKEEARIEKVLPLHKAEYMPLTTDEMDSEQPIYRIWPDADSVINQVMPNYVAGYVYCALVEAFACEQNARMTAMKAANDSAADMLKSLNIEYNHIRQASITQEITEVIGGAKALKSKKK
ncbi:MAG: ATP synthase F1 subunit gamma [Eubacterium sp.]|nr:ATP synthase F1 subunit gamma [Eubacterium sp.]